jgi:Na+-driven multidrug efflux pump
MTLIFLADQGASIEISGNGSNPFKAVYQRKQLSSVSTALLLALGLGVFEAFALYLGSGTFLRLIGVSAVCFHVIFVYICSSTWLVECRILLILNYKTVTWIVMCFLNNFPCQQGNPALVPAQKFLSLRALGAPAVVLSLALQGIFRGFKDTKTPVICLGKCLV